jgi:hypothetical protein
MRHSSQSSDERVRPDDTDEPRLRWRRWRVIPALAVAALALAALILVQRSELAEERSRMEAVALSERFIEAHNRGDYETARALVADTAEISMNPARSVDELEREMTWLEATGSVITSNGCEATLRPPKDPVHVLCSLTHENAWSRVMGLEPDTRGFLTLDVVSGEIATALLSLAPMSFSSEAVAAFETWLAETHPDDLEEMFLYHRLPGVTSGLPALTPESIELWGQHTDEFVEARRGRVDPPLTSHTR